MANAGNVQLEREQLDVLLGKWSFLRGANDAMLVSLTTQICQILQRDKRYLELDMFLKALPLEDIYMQNELIVRAKVAIAFQNGNYPLVYNLMKSHNFQNGEDLIEIWDKAHYAEEERRTQKPLTSLARFRIRQRFIPPESICPTGERKKCTLPKKSKDILQDWLNENIDKPYPSREVKEYLSNKADLTTEQVTTWYANARRRIHNARFKRLRCHGGKGRSKGRSEGAGDSDKASDHVIRSGRRQCLVNKTNRDENTTIENDKDMNESSSETDNTGSHPVISAAATESVSGKDSKPHPTTASSSHSYETEATSSLTPHDFLKLVPLELVQPSVSICSNIPYGYPLQFNNCIASIRACAVLSKQTPCNLAWSSNTPWLSFSSHPTSSQFSGTMEPRGSIMYKSPVSPGQLTRFNAATALLDMSAYHSSRSVVD